MEISLYGAFASIAALFLTCVSRGGRIINISTILPCYDSAKAAMLTFSKAVSFEFAADGIFG
jgi:NAD(P)-dependent dehydrogenase (short-subunit alcohol dehydrogenase family)